MVVSIYSPNILLKKEMVDLLNKKIKLLSRRCKNLFGIYIRFKTEKITGKATKKCEIKLIIPGNDLIAFSQCKTFEEAISETSEALERQIEKRKTKLLPVRNA